MQFGAVLSGSISKPKYFRPTLFAAIRVEPLPQKGSKNS